MEEDVTHESPDRGPAHRILSVLGLLAVLAGAVLGGNPFGIREWVFGSPVPPPRPPAVGREAAAGVDDDATVLRSQPWWQTVARLRGTGQMVTQAFTIGGDALQWRVRTSCTDGDIAVEVSTEAEPLVAAPCPSTPDGYSSETGSLSLRVAAKGPWRLHIEQQIDVPLEEPPPSGHDCIWHEGGCGRFPLSDRATDVWSGAALSVGWRRPRPQTV